MATELESVEDELHLRVFRNRPEPANHRIHVHQTHEINFLCHGYQGLEVENRTYTMCPGDLLVLPAGSPHNIREDESLPYRRIRLSLPVHFFDQLFRESIGQEGISQALFGDKEWVIRFPDITASSIENILEHMVDEDEQRAPGWEIGIRSCAALLMLVISRNLDNAIQPVDPAVLRRRHDMNVVIHFMEEHYSDPVSLTGMAQIFDVHPSVLSRNFKRATGVSPMVYLNRIRIAQAKKLMETSDQKLEEIAKKVGYSSLIYFSRVFKQLNGASPSQYRKSQR